MMSLTMKICQLDRNKWYSFNIQKVSPFLWKSDLKKIHSVGKNQRCTMALKKKKRFFFFFLSCTHQANKPVPPGVGVEMTDNQRGRESLKVPFCNTVCEWNSWALNWCANAEMVYVTDHMTLVQSNTVILYFVELLGVKTSCQIKEVSK